MNKFLSNIRKHGNCTNIQKICAVMPLDIIKLNYEWDWKAITINPNITWDFILSNLDKPWNWHVLCSRDDFKLSMSI